MPFFDAEMKITSYNSRAKYLVDEKIDEGKQTVVWNCKIFSSWVLQQSQMKLFSICKVRDGRSGTTICDNCSARLRCSLEKVEKEQMQIEATRVACELF